ncbi:MAG: endonuclease/exonuclease/phosphatase family protein [Polyangiales bacterium]
MRRPTSLVALFALAACDATPLTALDRDGSDAAAVARDDGSVTDAPDAPTPMDARPSLDAPAPRDVGTPLDRPDVEARRDAGARVDLEPPGPSTVERTYRVLHWNIAGGKENDCEPGLITRAVLRYVRENDVDLVGLNEVCPSQFEAIEDALRAHWRLGAREPFAAFVGDNQARVVGNAIYSRFGAENVTRLQVGADQYGERNLLCAQLASLPHLRFCATHLTPADVTARAQAGRVFDRLDLGWTERRDTVILTGDLNLHPNDPGLDAVYAEGANTRNNPSNRGAWRELDADDDAQCRG